VVVSDFNGDGKLDVAVGTQMTAAGQMVMPLSRSTSA
jgi:hypothetical protein